MIFGKFDKFLALFFVVVLAVIFVSAAGEVNVSKPYHFLQQIAKSPADLTSVDSDNSGNVDFADAAIRVKCPDGTFKEAKDCGFSGGAGSSCSLAKTGLVDVNSTLCGGVYCAKHDQFQHNKVCELLGYKSAATSLTATPTNPGKGLCALWNGAQFVASSGDFDCGYAGIAKIDCWKEDCSVSSASLPDCATNQYLKRNAADTNWECVENLFENQIKSISFSNWSQIPSGTADTNCTNFSLPVLGKLSDGLFGNALYCKDFSGHTSPNKAASFVLDLGQTIKTGFVYVDLNGHYAALVGGSGSVNFWVTLYSSVDGVEYTQIAKEAFSTLAFRPATISGSFGGRYIKMVVEGHTYDDEYGNLHTTKGEVFINEVQVFKFTN